MSIFNNMRLLVLLPQLFRTGNLIIKALEDRKLNSAEVSAIVTEMRVTIKAVPELGAFLAIFDSLVKVAAVVLPTFLGDKAKIIALGLQETDLKEAIAVTHLMDQIIAQAVVERKEADSKLTDDDIEGMI